MRRTILSLEALEERAVPASYIWTGAVSNQWADSHNWSGGTPPFFVPGPNDDVSLPSGAQVYYNGGYFNSVRSLSMGSAASLSIDTTLYIGAGGIQMNGGTITSVGPGDNLQVSGDSNWNSGNFLSALASPAAFLITTAAHFNFQGTFTFDNHVIVQSGQSELLGNGQWRSHKGAGIKVEGGARFSIVGDGDITRAAGPLGTFINEGEVFKGPRSGLNVIEMNYTQGGGGRTEIWAGTLHLTGAPAGSRNGDFGGELMIFGDATLFAASAGILLAGVLRTDGSDVQHPAWIEADVLMTPPAVIDLDGADGLGALNVIGNVDMQPDTQLKITFDTTQNAVDLIWAKRFDCDGWIDFTVIGGDPAAGTTKAFIICSEAGGLTGTFILGGGGLWEIVYTDTEARLRKL